MGVVAAGHPLTAEAGAQVLREGGNAVDAAICSVLTSFITESLLTGIGAGGFMLVHEPGSRSSTLVDFFVAAGGAEGAERGSELEPIPVDFGDTTQDFHVGAASCGVPGTLAGLDHVARRFGSVPQERLVEPAVGLARDGVRITSEQAYFHEILSPILVSTPECAALYEPEGRPLAEGDVFRFPDAGDALERFASEGAEPFYRGEVARAVANWVGERGGTLGPGDMAAYEPIEREPVRAAFRGAEVLTNPPPSSGGILIACALNVLEGLGESTGVPQIVTATEAANARRTEEFAERLHDPASLDDFFAGEPPSTLGSTTHISVLDAAGVCASVTCSNGTGSGLVVPGTGVHVNNMLGEEDLNPGGFHRIPPGRRVSSMMAPTIAQRDGEVVLGLGSAGSNRIRSAILGTAVRVLEQGMGAEEAVRAPRIHFEAGTVQAEPGVSEEGLAAVEDAGIPVVRWSRQNIYFGGVQAVVRDPASGEISGGGDPRRGGAVVLA
ncbi:MAG: gamma-glutamyltransferase [Actinobacteria bacterium]|nr:gamma-glutamyltransferase [Actinomycetota bacterium]